VGTAPNILLKGFLDDNYPNSGLNFLTFTLFATPCTIIMILISWVWLSVKWLPREYLFDWKKSETEEIRPDNSEYLKNMLVEKYRALGPTS
jgi:di/tricarboxylate transporter